MPFGNVSYGGAMPIGGGGLQQLMALLMRAGAMRGMGGGMGGMAQPQGGGMNGGDADMAALLGLRGGQGQQQMTPPANAAMPQPTMPPMNNGMPAMAPAAGMGAMAMRDPREMMSGGFAIAQPSGRPGLGAVGQDEMIRRVMAMRGGGMGLGGGMPPMPMAKPW